MLFTEDFLHYIWKFRLFDRLNLRTTGGEELEVYSVGMHNSHAGADFQNARIRVGETTWAGNAELHISSSDWHKHGHTTDNAYDNVILHVVYSDDQPLIRTDGKPVPTLELKDRISPELYNRYHNLVFGNQQIIPCEGTIATVDGLTMQNWLTRILVERLEKRSEAVIAALALNRGDWEETFYQFLAANFGFKTNALPFELMAKSLPQSILAKNKNNAMQIEALIFGQAGFLTDDLQDDYPLSLKKEYHYLAKKYSLQPIENHLWKFLRMRPQNFPTVRLAQFAALVVQSNHLFSKILEIREVKDLRELFSNIKINDYWETHYRFDKESKPAGKTFGQGSVDTILLNTVVLFLFSYGRHMKLQHFVSRALKLLENIPAEQNTITADFATLGVDIKTAFESQALLELKNTYCDYKKCLQCGVGIKILKPN
ncbi:MULTISPECIES: DUF2851 family protein [unclassified Mucilaginibacter]|uniref:DUF2851 family protein n=1 Tax=unclassified Mucilaginibacter TaxID=2617802 RepID=UPI002AC9742D|nr:MULTISPECIES: DUF2851 family protein [unclassified Mucilaginibacter]MEB0262165.1 DUF2851 family protein [Mucilaginibacter sp. 10I4]MEB0277025.1 DUF2851 family protein [Mucilaginibacter sp. 10B2]MEB0302970.1 DUF2851 family protein [Mucilaginibacter sp. 5C4]WPX25125.1 DUF2851 family protein [Mucilaginibacter sp. 5C4]